MHDNLRKRRLNEDSPKRHQHQLKQAESTIDDSEVYKEPALLDKGFPSSNNITSIEESTPTGDQLQPWDECLKANNVTEESKPSTATVKRVGKLRRQKLDGDHRFICDTGGGRRPTIHEKAWVVCSETGTTAKITPYQSNQTFEHPVVSAMTKATVSNLSSPVPLKVNHATCVSSEHDPDEKESLLTTWDISEFGVTVDGVHPTAPKCGITVEGTFMEFDHDHECVFFSISKP